MQNVLVFLDFVKRLYKSRYMLKMLALRELKSSYVGSAFGFLWAVINPLLQVAIYGIVFGVFFKSEPDPIYGTDSYFLFLLCGLIPWQFFAQTATASSSSIKSNFMLIKKAVGFPAEVLPIVTVISNLLGHFISLALLLIIIAVFTGGFPAFMPLVLAYLFFISIFAIGTGWVLSSVNVFLRDVEQILGLVIMGWFFFTPVVYSPSILPGKAQLILKLNPMYHMVEGYRLALLSGRALPWPDFVYLAAVSIVMFAAGGLFFRKLKPWFAEVL